MTDLLIFADAVFYNTTGLIFVVLGVFVLIRISGFPDLTVDGSFTFGAALFSVSMVHGLGTPLALLAALLGGAFGGLLTWTINNQLGVGKVVSGVLSMIILLLSAPYLTSGSTQSLLRVESIHSTIDSWDASLTTFLVGEQPFQMHLIFSAVWLIAFVVIGGLAFLAFRSRLGLRLRYIGSSDSPVLVPRAEQRKLLLVGLVAGNGLIGLGGAIEAQRRGGYTSNMGIGILLVALAVMVLGEASIKSFRKRDHLHLSEYAVALIIGCVVYSAGIQLLLALRIDFVDLRLLTAFFLLALLGYAGRVHSSSAKLF